MKHLLPLPLLLCLACAPFGLAHAEKADRQQPMNIEADALRHDAQQQTSVFTGRVVVTKGSIVLRGARLEVREDAQGYQSGGALSDELQGATIVYNNLTDVFSVDGQKGAPGATGTSGGRVRAVLAPKDAPAPAPAGTPGAPLRPSTTLGNGKP